MSSEVSGAGAEKPPGWTGRTAVLMNPGMRIRVFVLIGSLVALAACSEPLGKKPMLAGCEAAATALRPELSGVALDYRAVVGREAILRYQLPDEGGDPHALNIKCKVSQRGALTRIKIDSVRARDDDFATAKAAFASAVGK